MIEPVILCDQILAHAEAVEQLYFSRWAACGDFCEVAEVRMRSPVDLRERDVRFQLARFPKPVKGQTVPGIRDEYGKILKPGSTVILNRDRITGLDQIGPVLLHEITHAVDPVFEEEFAALNPADGPRRRLTKDEEYRLQHERRAFPAMWTGRLKAALGAGTYRDPQDAIFAYRADSPEFNGFCGWAPDLAELARDHFTLIVENLRGRGRRSPASPDSPAG